MTHREFATWCAWLDEDWNRPDRTDWYLMQIAAEVRYVLSKKRSYDLSKMKIPFKSSSSKVGRKTEIITDPLAATAIQKRAWEQRLGDISSFRAEGPDNMMEAIAMAQQRWRERTRKKINGGD